MASLLRSLAVPGGACVITKRCCCAGGLHRESQAAVSYLSRGTFAPTAPTNHEPHQKPAIAEASSLVGESPQPFA
jgi:hypothetical protein